ncbi:unnamed protein product [Gongylonema pulchrum]|uniref:C-type lectin domain-containing protein n=1 Tax=Gongylonema pulchrum TaxID=637853 RepID=A0A183D646_9BILA|nr:unnamed protein product [Gongylonema pulchrum]
MKILDQFKAKFESYWIGLKKNADNEWEWIDGTKPTTLRWRITQPDLCCGFGVTCTLVNYVGTDGYWDDAGCEYIWNFIGQGYACKKNATAVI